MRIEDCYLLGRILKAHNLHGECKAYFDVDFIEDYEEMESVYLLQGNKLTPFFIENFRIISANQAILKFRNILDRDAIVTLSGLEMYLPLDQLPELSDDQFYFHEIVGFTIADQALGDLGLVVRVDEFPSQPVIVMTYKGREVLIPIADQIVGKVDREAKTISTRLPEGLLEVYLGGDEDEDEMDMGEEE